MTEIKVFDRSETASQSIWSDVVTFSFLVLCIWFSWHMGGGFWTLFTACMFIASVSAKTSLARWHTFKSKQELLDWANSLPEEKEAA